MNSWVVNRYQVAERFWNKVTLESELRPKMKELCWLWIGGKMRKGYGRFTSGKKNHLLAHRIAWQLTNGPIPEGMCVLHRCDNPACVNPAHLWLGTVQDNNQDMIEKGRFAPPEKHANPGEKNPSAKLTWDQVRAIRRVRAYYSQTELGSAFGVSQRTISFILRGEHWRGF